MGAHGGDKSVSRLLYHFRLQVLEYMTPSYLWQKAIVLNQEEEVHNGALFRMMWHLSGVSNDVPPIKEFDS